MTRIRLISLIGLVAGIAVLAAISRRAALTVDNQRSADTVNQNPSSGSAERVVATARPTDRTASRPASAANSTHTALLGSVVAPVQAVLSARMPSRIRRVLAVEGQAVRPSQILVELDETEFETQEETARAGVAAAQAQVEKARAGLAAQRSKADADTAAARGALAQAEIRLKQAIVAQKAAEDEQQADLQAAIEGERRAQVAVDRAAETARSLEELSSVGGVSRSDLEGARAQLRVARSDRESAKNQTARLRQGINGVPYRVVNAQREADSARAAVKQAQEGVRVAERAGRQSVTVAEKDRSAALAALDQAAAGLKGAQAARAQLRLASPIDGLVTSVVARAGETAQPGTPLVTIVSRVGLRVDALVPARLLALVSVGARATVSVDTFPGREFRALVSDIARVAEPDGRSFRVKFRLLGEPPLLPGQTARVKVLTGR